MAAEKKATKKVKEVAAAGDTASESLQAQIEALKKALAQRSAEADAYRVAAQVGGNEKVLIKNTGLMQVVVQVDESGKSVVLDGRGPRSTGQIPLHVYEQLLRETKYFENGVLVRVGDTTYNPNVIVDYTEWFDDLPESGIAEKVNAISSHGVLNRLYDFTEGNTTGKALVLRREVIRRISELFDYQLQM